MAAPPVSDPELDDDDFGEEVTGDLPVPEYWMENEDVEQQEFQYSTRHPTDWVISGPLPQGGGPGRRFANWTQAERWAREFYGERFRGRIAEAAVEGHNRWAFLIRGPRGEGAK
jgi:hypothetical protein